jgi:N-acetylglutamate synthase-like GNAT family acetyltransferase
MKNMKNSYLIERAKSSDYPLIAELLRVTNLPLDGIESHLDNFLVIRYRGKSTEGEFLVGSVGLEVYGASALLRSLAVHPDLQGHGLGTQLVNEIIKMAGAKGITHLFLLTDTAADFFEKKKFIFVTRDEVPEDMKQSVEFKSLCTSSPSMMLQLSGSIDHYQKNE